MGREEIRIIIAGDNFIFKKADEGYDWEINSEMIRVWNSKNTKEGVWNFPMCNVKYYYER